MLSADSPVFAPVLLPTDRPTLESLPELRLRAAVLSATYGVNPRTQPLINDVRRRTDLLLVDPKTAAYQYEGYMSMEDYRAVAYSPGRSSLGTLWEPSHFATPEARKSLIEAVFRAQIEMEADLLLAPYFAIPDASHPWLDVAVQTASEALALAGEGIGASASTDALPVGAAICIDIDALLRPGAVDEVGERFVSLPAAFYWVMATNYDERQASPQDVRAVMQLLERLQRNATPTLLAYCGRSGLVAVARGAAGYCSGLLELEAYPQRYLREGLINLHANNYYLEDYLVQLPTRLADAVLSCAGAPPCECTACQLPGPSSSSPPLRPTRMVSRRLGAHGLVCRQREIAALRAQQVPQREDYLRGRFDDALRRCVAVQTTLPELTNDAFHYLDVLRELVGGPAASIPDAGAVF